MKLDTISSICSLMHDEARNKNFYAQSEEQLNVSANNFVDKFCTRNGLTAHTISPLRWSFESDEHGMIQKGVIELRNISNEDTEFKSVDLSDVKLTDDDNIMHD